MKVKDKELFTLHAEVCKALAHPKRLEILHLLEVKGRQCAADLLRATKLTKTNLSQQMRVLGQLGLVTVERDGIQVCYELSSPKIGEACEILREFLLERLNQQRIVLKNTRPL